MGWIFWSVWFLWMCYWILRILIPDRYSYRIIKNNYSDNSTEYKIQRRVKGSFLWHSLFSSYHTEESAMDAMQFHIEYDAKQSRKVTKKEVVK